MSEKLNTKKTVTIRLSEEIYAALKKQAETDYRSLNNVIELQLKKSLEQPL